MKSNRVRNIHSKIKCEFWVCVYVKENIPITIMKLYSSVVVNNPNKILHINKEM